MADASLAATPLPGDSNDLSPAAKGRARTRKQQAVGDPHLSAEGRAAILALTADDAFGEYLDAACSDDQLSPL